MAPKINEDSFGSLDETLIRRFTLTNSKGTSVQVISYGATITSIKVLDKSGTERDVVLGFDTLEDYINDQYYIGSTVGRCANRTSNASFIIDDKKYDLDVNVKPNAHLHGGFKGFNKAVWDARLIDNSVVFTYVSPSGESGYPGEVTSQVSYELTEENELVIKYRATSTEKTPINLTNHAYFNLGGHEAQEGLKDHVVTISADHYTPLDDNLITTGEIVSVDGTPLDLRDPCKMEKALSLVTTGFDHNYCINGDSEQLNFVSRVSHPSTGLIMEMFSTQPGVQFYTSNCFPDDDSIRGKDGVIYRKQGSFCLEAQNYPDAVNKPHFPNAIIGPDDVYEHTTIYKFNTTK